jgi:hypothetical protein
MVVGGSEFVHRSVPVAVPSKAFVCGRLIRGIADSNFTAGMYIRLLYLLCVVQVAVSATS